MKFKEPSEPQVKILAVEIENYLERLITLD
jgi:hypothetical protein